MIVFLCDISVQHGSGHVMRCLAVAEQLQEDGHTPVFVANVSNVDWVKERLNDLGLVTYEEQQDHLLDQILALRPSVVVIDSYQDRSILALEFRRADVPVLAIADAATPPMPAQVVVTPGPLPGSFNWTANHIFGMDYLLLRDEVLKVRDVRTQPTWKPAFENEVLVVLGGTGESDLIESDTFEVLLPVLSDLSDFRWKVFANPNKIEKYQNQVDQTQATSISLIPTGLQIFEVAKRVNLALSSAGVSSLEFVAMNIPLVVIQTASNQDDNVQFLKSSGCADFVGRIDELETNSVEASQRLREAIAKAREMGCTGGSAIDVGGTKRVAGLVESLAVGSETKAGYSASGQADFEIDVTLGEVTTETATWLWEERFTSEVMVVSGTQEIPTLEQHLNWLKSPTGKASKIILVDKTPVGSVRIDQDIDASAGRVSVFVVPEWQGKGIAVQALKHVEQTAKPGTVLVAQILDTNIGSQRTFARAGYVKADKHNVIDYPGFSVSTYGREGWSIWLRRVPA